MENYMAKFEHKGENRPTSANREAHRDRECRPVHKEFQINHEMGFVKDQFKDEGNTSSMMET